MSTEKKDTRPYWQQRRDLKNKAPHGKGEKEKEKKDDKKQKADWFGAQTVQAPSKCENCKNSLKSTISFHPRGHIAHIVKKTKQGGCPSVATHPMNRWFGCISCHTGYDKAMDEGDYYEVIQMAVWPLIVERFKQVFPHIVATEIKNVPKVLKDAITDK